MDIKEKIDNYLNESTTMSAFGVTTAQVKSVYKRDSWGKYVPDANAQWKKVDGKKAVKDLLKASNTYSPSVAGVDKDGNLFLVIWVSHRKEYHIAKYSPEGEKLTSWNEKSPQKALSYFSGVRDYYFANKGTVDQKSPSDVGTEEFDNTALADKLVMIIGKEAKKLFEEYRAKAAAKISAKLNAGDFTGAYHLLNNWVETGNFKRDVRDTSMREMLMGRGWSRRDFHDFLGEIINGGSPGSYGYSPAIDRILKSASDEELRKGGAELLRGIKTTLEEAIKE